MKRLALCSLILLLLPLSHAMAEPGGRLSGLVTDTADAPLSGIVVYASIPDGGIAGQTETSIGGTFVIEDLPAGSYEVQFQDPTTTFATQWFDGKEAPEEADPVTVEAGAEITGINARLRRTGRISGMVRDEETGDPIANVCVNAQPLVTPTSVGTHTRPDGSYVIPGLAPDMYKVSFRDCNGDQVYLTEWYDDVEDPRAAMPIEVREDEETTSVDAALTPGGIIVGLVTNIHGDPLGGICVWIYRGTSLVWQVFTHETGEYQVGPLPADEYSVRFLDCDGHGLAEQWYAGKLDQASADVVTVSPRTTAIDIDAIMVATSTIEGTLTDDAGTPRADACAFVHAAGGAVVGSAQADEDGRYRAEGLKAGTYRVRFDSCSSPGMLKPVWWNGADEEGQATPLSVGPAETVSGIDASLERLVILRGIVSSLHNGEPVEACVEAFTAEYQSAAYVNSDEDGRYEMRLPSGAYAVSAACVHDHARGWYGDVELFEDATFLTLQPGEERFDIDIRLCAAPPLRDSDGDGLTDCRETRLGTDPLLSDSDGDGLGDHEEIEVHETDPLDPDTDNDGFTDGIEVNGGSCAGVPALQTSNPRDARSTPYATAPDGFEQGPVELPLIC